MYAVDLHAHTRFFHGHRRLGGLFDPLGARLLARVARARDLDGVATTNHDYYRSFEVDVPDLTVLPGIEVSTTEGHVLVVGPDPPAETTPGELTPEETVALAHERDCAAIVAHPYRNSTVRNAGTAFDAVEINGKGTHTHDWVTALARERNLPVVGGSDAHYPFEVGRAYTLVDAEDPTPESVVAAIRDGRVSARVSTTPGQRLLRWVYRQTHRQKGHLQSREPSPPGVGAPPGEGGE